MKVDNLNNMIIKALSSQSFLSKIVSLRHRNIKLFSCWRLRVEERNEEKVMEMKGNNLKGWRLWMNEYIYGYGSWITFHSYSYHFYCFHAHFNIMFSLSLSLEYHSICGIFREWIWMDKMFHPRERERWKTWKSTFERKNSCLLFHFLDFHLFRHHSSFLPLLCHSLSNIILDSVTTQMIPLIENIRRTSIVISYATFKRLLINFQVFDEDFCVISNPKIPNHVTET